MRRLTKKQLQDLEQLEQVGPVNWEFEYVKDLPPHLQRMAAFWEYARESQHVIDLAKAFRKVAWQKSKKAGQELIAANRAIIRVDELLLLATPYFPGVSFEDYRANLFPSSYENFGHFGIVDLLCLPIQQFAPFLQSDELMGFVGAGDTVYSLTIPWNYTDHELTTQFKEALRVLRPTDQPEPRRAGRPGRTSGINPCDILNQLVAFRLDKEGISFEDAGDVVTRLPYTSKKGWMGGIRKARIRIANMETQPFFRHS